MLKIFTYYDEVVREYFKKSLLSLASALPYDSKELIIFSDYTLPNKDEKALKAAFNHIQIIPLRSHTLSDTDDANAASNQAFVEVLIKHTDQDRIFIDPTIFVVNDLVLDETASVFYRQYQGHLSTKLCYLKAGDQFKNVFSAIRRASALRITNIEFTYAIHRNYLIEKKLSNKQIVNGSLFNTSPVTELNTDHVIAIDMEGTRMRANEKTTKIIKDLEKSRKPIQLTKITNREPVKESLVTYKNNYITTTTTSTTEDPNRYPFSILITAYKTADYIEECLDSIEAQTYFIDNDDYEILIGVDACEETLAKLKEIQHKYRNLNVYMMQKNSGTYITTNTLLSLAKNDYILRFDSDDIMRNFLVKEVAANRQYPIVRLSYNNFQNSNKQLETKTHIAHGIIHFKKSMMDNLAGGYQPWKCGADTELIQRLGGSVKVYTLKNSVFYRRLHQQSLTLNPNTGFESDLRKSYKKQIKQSYLPEEVFVKRVTTKYDKII